MSEVWDDMSAKAMLWKAKQKMKKDKQKSTPKAATERVTGIIQFLSRNSFYLSSKQQRFVGQMSERLGDKASIGRITSAQREWLEGLLLIVHNKKQGFNKWD
jgi:hypothetical protein